jgi:hypothetical protein
MTIDDDPQWLLADLRPLGPAGRHSKRAIKRALDPVGSMSPGKLGL